MKLYLSLILILLLLVLGCSKAQQDSITKEEHTSVELSKNYYEYNEEEYKKAISDGKTVFLEFYAPWCPICRSQEPQLKAGLAEIDNKNFIAFRVDYDKETSLKKQFQVPYQHTHVIVKGDKVLHKSTGSLNKEETINVIKEVF